jgi:hypothetical protein
MVKKFLIAAIAAGACALAGTAGAALQPNVYDPTHTGCVVSKAEQGWLHLEKNCPTTTAVNAGADITGVSGQPFTSASFTLKSTSQCQGGSPRFNIVTTVTTYFLGCNNVTPVVNADGTATYTFTAATIAAGGHQVPVPTGTITSARVLIDVQGVADVKNVTLNGVPQLLQQGHKHHGHGKGDEQGDHQGHHGHHHEHDHDSDDD